MRILITGGAGFIGTWLAAELVMWDHVVTVLDRKPVTSDFVKRYCQTVQGDCRAIAEAVDWGTIEYIEPDGSRCEFQKPDFIYHLAATVGVKNVLADPKECIENNVESLRAVLALGIPGIYASTSEVYGKTLGPLAEESDCIISGKARWSYAASKLTGEWLAKASGWKTVRFFNVVGPRQSNDYGAVLPTFVGRALQGNPIEVHGDGSQLRTFLDVKDCVEILDTLRDKEFDVVNVGSHNTVSIYGLAQLVKHVTKSDSEIRFVPHKQVFGPEFEECPERVPDLRKLHSLIGYKSYRDLEQTIRDLANSIKEQEYVAVGR